jgi:hypothetical protein
MRLAGNIAACLLLLIALKAQDVTGSDLSKLDLKNVNGTVTSYNGTTALKLTEKVGAKGEAIALIKDAKLRDGTIDVEVAGALAPGAADTARGFIGVAFRVQADASQFECIYLRPTNGRADDQLRRNHTTQYVSYPDWPWERLRKETPGAYESYVDMVSGEWTRMRIVVKGSNAALFVGDAPQPCLLVHDLKLGENEGSIGLWIGPGTEGYFRNLKILR